MGFVLALHIWFFESITLKCFFIVTITFTIFKNSNRDNFKFNIQSCSWIHFVSFDLRNWNCHCTQINQTNNIPTNNLQNVPRNLNLTRFQKIILTVNISIHWKNVPMPSNDVASIFSRKLLVVNAICCKKNNYQIQILNYVDVSVHLCLQIVCNLLCS